MAAIRKPHGTLTMIDESKCYHDDILSRATAAWKQKTMEETPK
jgi:hypothetical protein